MIIICHLVCKIFLYGSLPVPFLPVPFLPCTMDGHIPRENIKVETRTYGLFMECL